MEDEHLALVQIENNHLRIHVHAKTVGRGITGEKNFSHRASFKDETIVFSHNAPSSSPGNFVNFRNYRNVDELLPI